MEKTKSNPLQTDLLNQLADAGMKLERNSTYEDYKLQYSDFIVYCKYIQKFIQTKENPDNFEITFITQGNDNNGIHYCTIDELFINFENALYEVSKI